MFFFHDKSA